MGPRAALTMDTEEWGEESEDGARQTDLEGRSGAKQVAALTGLGGSHGGIAGTGI